METAAAAAIASAAARRPCRVPAAIVPEHASLSETVRSASAGVRWGVLGCANITQAQFLPALAEAGGSAVVVGSRDAARATEFAAAHGIARAVGGYEAVLADPEVQAVYVP